MFVKPVPFSETGGSYFFGMLGCLEEDTKMRSFKPDFNGFVFCNVCRQLDESRVVGAAATRMYRVKFWRFMTHAGTL